MLTIETDTVLVFDMMNMAFRWKHSKAKTFVKEYLNTVESLKKSYKAGKVVLTCDWGASSYRKNILPSYKSGRLATRERQTEVEKADFEQFMKEFEKVILEYQSLQVYPLLRFKNVEADDLGAYIVRKWAKTHRIWLMSSDKDWDLLVSDNVSRFSYVTRKEITLETWNEHYDYNPDDHVSIKCLTGDSGDSIPGVEGIGPAKAHALVREYGSCYDVIASLPISSKYKHIANLNRFGAEALLLNYKLMDLVTYCDEAIGAENCKEIDRILGEYLAD